MTEKYVSPCAAHYYQACFAFLDTSALAEQRRMLEEGLLAIAEQQDELFGLGGRQGTKLRNHLRREAAELAAKLAAIDELMSRPS